MNPYLIGGASLFLFAGGATLGWKVNNWRHDSLELAVQKGAEAATLASVDAIKDIRIQRVTVRQELEREIRLQPVPAVCDLSDGLFDTLNKAITGEGGSGVGVSGTDATVGQDP